MTATAFTPKQIDTLGALFHEIIPSSSEHGIPGAGDGRILGPILEALTPHVAMMTAALATLEAIAEEKGGKAFSQLGAQARTEAALDFQSRDPMIAGFLGVMASQIYYCDDEVMISLGLEPRAPFPLGHEVDQGDWSLLDVVKGRRGFWRQTS